MRTNERVVHVMSGWGMLVLTVVLYFVSTGLIVYGAVKENPWIIIPLVFGFLVAGLLSAGFFTLEPNQTAVLILFGAYKGTVNQDGFHWANPFLKKVKVSMRTRNFNTDTLKVNDNQGNPIEIGAVVVWKVANSAQAIFDVDDFEEYVETQSESAVRHLASMYPYDLRSAEGDVSLRGSADEVAQTLMTELQERMNKAGILIEEARLSHLAYAPEIASAMLQRQQAQAIVDARVTIVEGAVSMVEMALDRLKSQNIVHLDEDKQATMVSNLLVVLCGDKAAHPVINTGTLHQ